MLCKDSSHNLAWLNRSTLAARRGMTRNRSRHGKMFAVRQILGNLREREDAHPADRLCIPAEYPYWCWDRTSPQTLCQGVPRIPATRRDPLPHGHNLEICENCMANPSMRKISDGFLLNPCVYHAGGPCLRLYTCGEVENVAAARSERSGSAGRRRNRRSAVGRGGRLAAAERRGGRATWQWRGTAPEERGGGVIQRGSARHCATVSPGTRSDGVEWPRPGRLAKRSRRAPSGRLAR